MFTRGFRRGWVVALTAGLFALAVACANKQSPAPQAERATRGAVVEGVCEVETGDAADPTSNLDPATGAPSDAGAPSATAGQPTNAPDYLPAIGCTSDFNALASLPMDATIPGARSAKFVIDTQDLSAEADSSHRRLYFQNSVRYPLHVNFCCKYIRGVSCLESDFLDTYYSPNRRFLAGAITHYENLDLWALEMAPYDTASPAMVKSVFDAITADRAFFRSGLAFHPTSDEWEARAQYLDPSIPIVTTDEIYAGTDYQPLTRATSMGVIRYYTQAEIESGADIPYNSIVVLDTVPNDITVVSGVISEQFQSPLSHVNVLCTNRGTPNMGLRDARRKLSAFQNKWVELSVDMAGYDIHEVDAATGAAYYVQHLPNPVELPAANFGVSNLENVEDLIPNYAGIADSDKRNAIKEAVRAWGGKSANYSVMAQTKTVPVPKAFAIPVYWYDKFMRDNGLYDMLDAFQANPDFTSTTDSTFRQESLRQMRNAILQGTIDQTLQDALLAKLKRDYLGNDGKFLVMRFRTSTNSEDLDAFPCAGCYESHTGDPSVWGDVLNAIRLAYASAWLFRTYEERSYYRVDHKSVAMGLLVHHHFDGETSNGVAITSNPYDSTGTDNAVYVNVEYGGNASVVHLPAGVTTDQFLSFANGSTSYISHSNLIPAGQHVLSDVQVHQLSAALADVHSLFASAYRDPGSNWYAMDVEFKFIACDALGNPTGTSTLWLKQARPYPSPFAGGP